MQHRAEVDAPRAADGAAGPDRQFAQPAGSFFDRLGSVHRAIISRGWWRSTANGSGTSPNRRLAIR